MFNIENHPELGLFVHYGEDYDDAYIASIGCCALGVHSFEGHALLGFNVCESCGQIEALFALRYGPHEDGTGNIYVTVCIEDVREFAGCTTVEECAAVVAELLNDARKKQAA